MVFWQKAKVTMVHFCKDKQTVVWEKNRQRHEGKTERESSESGHMLGPATLMFPQKHPVNSITSATSCEGEGG